MQDLEHQNPIGAMSRSHPSRPTGKAPLNPPRSSLSSRLSVGTAAIRYFAPSQAVWSTAKEAGLVPLLPVDQARMQARLAHNYELLGAARDRVATGCNAIIAMRKRFAQPDSDHAATEIWTVTPAQAELLASTASDTQIAIQGLLFRLRWSRIYEEGLLNGETAADIKMMTINQEEFEDPPAN